jgi:hypothetical protein
MQCKNSVRFSALRRHMPLDYRNALTLGLTDEKGASIRGRSNKVSFSYLPAIFPRQRLAMLAQAKLRDPSSHRGPGHARCRRGVLLGN